LLNYRYKPFPVNPFHGAVDAHHRAVYIWAKSQDGSEDHNATDTTLLHRVVAFDCNVAAAAAAAAAFAAAAAWPPFDFNSFVLGETCYFSSQQLLPGRPPDNRAAPFHVGPQIAVP
jgi:hypothetical protein